jgi:hypothetical protein
MSFLQKQDVRDEYRSLEGMTDVRLVGWEFEHYKDGFVVTTTSTSGAASDTMVTSRSSGPRTGSAS